MNAPAQRRDIRRSLSAMRRLRLTALMALAASSAGAAAAGAASPLDVLPVVATANGTSVAGMPGGYCVDVVPEPVQEDDGSICVDVSAPTRPPGQRLALRTGDLLHLRFQDNPRINDDVASVGVALGRVDRAGFHPRVATAATRVPGTTDQWTVRVQGRPRDNAFEVSAGFVSFLVGVRERRAR